VKVLIADDDSLFRQMLSGMLAAGGYETITASNGLEALEILEREHVRMLVVDWRMPGLDGPGLIRRIRSANWPGYTYIILLTAMSGREEIVEGLRVGADDYVTKPFRHEELLARMGVGARIVKLETGLSESLAREEERSGLDSLTGLPNRRALYARARAELGRAEREKTNVGVVMIDIDHFKQINDRLGHAGGDGALRLVADALRSGKRDYDCPGRWGGEEFLVILPGASLEHAAAVAERIRASMSALRLGVPGSEALVLESSFGVSSASPGTRPIGLDELLRQADDALYRAKAAGRNRVCVHGLDVEPCRVDAPAAPLHPASRVET
jgi:two-component system chemotaxis response regulator CheY